MANAKTATLSIRIEPALKDALRAAADHEHRSIANMVEVMIREYCVPTNDRALSPANGLPAVKDPQRKSSLIKKKA